MTKEVQSRDNYCMSKLSCFTLIIAHGLPSNDTVTKTNVSTGAVKLNIVTKIQCWYTFVEYRLATEKLLSGPRRWPGNWLFGRSPQMLSADSPLNSDWCGGPGRQSGIRSCVKNMAGKAPARWLWKWKKLWTHRIVINLSYESNNFFTNILTKWCKLMTKRGIAEVLGNHYSRLGAGTLEK